MLGSGNHHIDPHVLLESSGVEILVFELLDAETWQPVELLARAEEVLARLAARGPDGDPAHLALRARVTKSLMQVDTDHHELLAYHSAAVCRLLDAIGEVLRSVMVGYARDADFWVRWYVGPWREFRDRGTTGRPGDHGIRAGATGRGYGP